MRPLQEICNRLFNIESVLKGLEKWKDTSEDYPISVYDVHYKRSLQGAADILEKLIDHYDISIVMNNSLGYKSIFRKGNAARFLLKYNFPSDCYPIVRYLEKYAFGTGGVMNAFDVGANVGTVSCYLAMHAQTVHAFEPSPRTAELMKENILLNELSNIRLNVCGVGSKSGVQTFFDYGRELSGHNSFLQQEGNGVANAYEVPVVSLDKYCQKEKIEEINILKIDTEGYESEVLEGANSLLKNNAIKMIIFEISPGIQKDMERQKEMIYKLVNYGYTLKNLHNESLTIEQIDALERHQDIIAGIS